MNLNVGQLSYYMASVISAAIARIKLVAETCYALNKSNTLWLRMRRFHAENKRKTGEGRKTYTSKQNCVFTR